MPGPILDFIIDRSGEPQPWTTVYNGIEYSGEVISADVDALPDPLDDRVAEFLNTLLPPQ